MFTVNRFDAETKAAREREKQIPIYCSFQTAAYVASNLPDVDLELAHRGEAARECLHY